MTEKKNESPDKKTPESVIFGLKLFSVIVLAFLAGLVFRRSVGVVSMFPIAFILCGLAAFVDIKPRYKLLLFPVTVFLLNTVETSDKSIALTYATLCLLANIVAEYSASAFKKKQKRFYAVAPIGFAVCIAISFITIGNPFTAIAANNRLTEYTQQIYPATENAFFGDFSFSTIYYNRNTQTYSYDATSSEFPTEKAEISYKNGVIRDGFKQLLERKIKEPYEVEFTAYLRDIIPSDSFSVECISIASKPDENILISQEGELKNNATYEIHLGGIQTGEDMMKRVTFYMNLLDRADAEYNEIIFKSGTGPFIRRSIKIDSVRQKFDYDFKLDYVPAGFDGEFSSIDVSVFN